MKYMKYFIIFTFYSLNKVYNILNLKEQPIYYGFYSLFLLFKSLYFTKIINLKFFLLQFLYNDSFQKINIIIFLFFLNFQMAKGKKGKKGKKKKGKKKKVKEYDQLIYNIPDYEDPNVVTPKVNLIIKLAHPANELLTFTLNDILISTRVEYIEK
jgi:hypothetical protein